MAVETVTITDTADDGFEATSFASIQPSLFAAGYNAGEFLALLAFLRFSGVNIARNQRIDSASITVNITVIEGSPNTNWYGVAADTVSQFGDPIFPSDQSVTAASIDGDPQSTGTHVVDVTAIVQEIINRDGWASGGAIAFVCQDSAGTGENYWLAEDLSDDAGAAASLVINYTIVPTTWRRRASARLGMRRG